MKRLTAIVLVLLMLVQICPSVGFATDTDAANNEEIIDQLIKPVYHTVIFTVDGEAVATFFVVDGAVVSNLPEAPEISGQSFKGWFDGEIPFTTDSIITADKVITAIYETVGNSDEYDHISSFSFTDTGSFAAISITGAHKPNQSPVASRDDSVLGHSVGEAWIISNIKNSTGLTLSAVVTALPDNGVLKAYSVNSDGLGNLLAEDLAIGDTVTVYLSMKSACGIAFVVENSEPAQDTEKTLTASGTGYRVSVTYTEESGIPEGAELAVNEISNADHLTSTSEILGWTEDDAVFYTKFLDIAITYDGEQFITLPSTITVDVELLDVGEGADALETVSIANGKARLLDSQAVADGTVTFSTDSLGTFGFASALRTFTSWTTDRLHYSLQGFTTQRQPAFAPIEIELEKGLEVLDAYGLQPTRGGRTGVPHIHVSTDIELAERESIVVYAIKNGVPVGILETSTDGLDDSISLGSADGFAVVLDSGYREKSLNLGDVELSGMMPKDSDAEAEEATVNLEGEVLAAYDIRILENGTKYQPDVKHPINVSINIGEVDGKTLQVWHINDDGTAEEITDYEIEEGKIRFTAVAFSIFAVVETKLTETVNASDGNTYEIEVTYTNMSGIPMEGTALLVSELKPGNAEYDAYVAASAAKVGTTAESIELSRVFDIQIVSENDHGTVYEPTGDVTVSIRLVGESLNDYANLDVLHFVEDENTKGFTVYDMNSSVDGETVQFTTDSFSVYVVVGSVYLRTYRFYTFNEYGEYVEYALYTDSGKTTFTQTIKNGEKPVAPQNPTNPQDPNATFAGWFEDIRESGATEPVFAENAYDFDNIPEITQNEEVHLYAKFRNYAYIIFHDQYDADTSTFPVAYTVRKELTDGIASISIADYRVNYHGSGNDMVFTGWSEVPITTPGATNNDENEAVERLDDTITVTGNKELYPIFTHVYWITFYSGYSGSGATYYPETYFINGEGPNSLANYIPTRNVGDNGVYTFTGWYAGATLEGEQGEEEASSSGAVQISDANGVLVPDFTDTSNLGISVRDGSIVLTENVTLYAVWSTTGTADYSIIIWKQKASDATGLADDNKSYDFAERATETGMIGSEVSVASSYTTRVYPGYTYSRCDSSKTIASDGSTVLNVYYDRDDLSTEPSGVYALTFDDSVTGANASASLPVAYDQESGDYSKIPYGTSLSELAPDTPVSGRVGYSFTSWYADRGCTIRVFFDQDAFDGYTGSKVLYATMPDQDVTVYAGWEETRYRVDIDPNYGAMYAYNGSHELVGTGATYFNGSYTSIIQEYTTITRDYVESASGTWYYVKHDRAFYDAGNTAAGNNRYTYYTQDPSEATEFTTFAYEPGVYRYAGWYEVFNYGQADEYESDTPYEFGHPVDHDTTLRLHWTKVGAFYLEYDPGVGTLNDNEDQETFYVDLDGDTYADNADVVITRIATPPDGYEFTGWTIRGDDSGNIYYPGSSFTLLTQYAATVQGKKTVYLDAVYTKVATASIVYDANGGTITESELDYGSPYDSTATRPIYSCDTDAGTATISNLVNNSRVYLSDGSGFTRTDATFVGWSNERVYDPDDANAIFYLPGEQTDEIYNVDTTEPFTLYAVWQVSVKYHLNQSTADANFGGDWGIGYTLNTAGDTYTQNVYIGTAVNMPEITPVYIGSSGLTFLYWATKDDSDNYAVYDFTQPVAGELDLYACWDAPLTLAIHAVDASAESLEERTSSDTDWKVTTPLTISAPSNAPIDLSSGAPTGSVTVPADYAFAFAAVYSSSADLQDFTESDAVSSIYSSSVDGKIHVVYQSGSDRALADDEDLYIIYYQQKKLEINYRSMADNGELTIVTVDPSAPSDTGSALGEYEMASGVTDPLAWVNNNTYTYFAFAIGSASANSAEDLLMITSTSNTDSTRPALLVRNSWRGLQYSTDTGTTWNGCGYAPSLYVVYFAKQATVVTFTENTVGLASDMSTAFTFDYKIETVNNADNMVTGTVYDTETPGNSPILLSNGEAHSAILFTDATTTQKVTITQTVPDEFTTVVSANGETGENPYSFTADGTGIAQDVTFTNTRGKAATVEIHVALVDVANGSITLDDTKRSNDSSSYSFDLMLGDQTTFEAVLPPTGVFTDDSGTYAFGGVLYGTDSGSTVTVSDLSAVSIACEQMDAGNANIYEIYLKDSAGNRLTELDEYTLYYLYYPMPVIRYVEETDGGVLTAIQGSLDGLTASDTITYNRETITLNGKTVAQDQKLEIPQGGRVISPSVGSEYFNMPPLLDRETDELYLVYSRIGTGAPDQTNVSSISVSDGLTLYLQIRDNNMEWSFDGSSWTAYTSTPTIYAIYQERGYTLEITKTVPIDTGFTDPFTLEISSTAINRASYAVEGTGNSEVSAVQANGTTPGTITVQVTDGSVIRIFGLGSGSYTITESGNENHTLAARESYIDSGESVSNDLSVTDNSSVTITLDKEKTVALTNTPKVICKVGTRSFHTIQSAVQWIEDNSATFSGTIEMLVDYLMPASDAPVIPYYLDVTLTTAPEYGSGMATITRGDNFVSGAMFTNSGKLTLQNITLDGNGRKVTASSAMIDNEGTLTVGSGASLQNAAANSNGGAINTWDGSVSVSGGTISNNTAANGSAIYATGGNVTVSSGTINDNNATGNGAIYYAGNGEVTISGGSISGNSAENGGAVYIEKGALTMSGGSLTANTAHENGGAVYAVNGAIEISGGVLGGSGTGNSAQNGGAIYLESGSVTVSQSTTISYNTASVNGGGVFTGTGSITISGGSLASNTAAGNGGGVYTASGAITVSGSSTAISSNEAANGGGLYSASGAISVANATFSGNSATAGNGGGVYADDGSVSLSGAKFTGNSADNGYGGGIYGNSSAITLTSCTFGGNSSSGNSAINGAAVYTNTGSATFSAGTVRFNTATEGGAVGVGSDTARLYFSGNAVVKDNTMSGTESNVYLDQDSDAVINATGLGGSASIGIYVPDKSVTVTDINGVPSMENLFDRRGVPGAFFATYTTNSNVSKFTNDRQPGLSVQQETSTKRLYWGKAFTVEVRYLESFSGSLNTVENGTVENGTVKNIDNQASITYYAPSSRNAASEIADDLRSAHTISNLSGTAVFAVAFVGTDRAFANYITDVNWDSADNRWSFIKRDGTEITGDKLVVYFSEPAYIQIENNTEYPMDISALTVLGQSVINSSTTAGYGYVFAKDGVIQNELRPVTIADLTLQPGKNIKLLLPGGKNAAWTLSGSFTGASADIPYTLNGIVNTLAAADADDFTLNGTTLNTNGGTYSIIFGGELAICKIVTTEISGVLESEIAGKTDPDSENQVEYTFSTLKQAVTFAQTHGLTNATIEMLVDYLIPASDVVSLPAGSHYTFTTATSGTYKYSDEAGARATISRDQGNNASFITALNGALVSGDYNTSLKVENLIFDGKNFGGSSISGGIIKTKACNVEIDNVDFRHCVAQFGGGIYIESVNKSSGNKTPYGSLKVTNSRFTGCQSLETGDKYGGGAIWTSMKDVTILSSSFTNCEAVHQAGAVFHYVGGNYATTSTVTNCTFEDCQSKAAGSLESGAKTVTIKGCTFRNSKATDRNGGAVNVYALDAANPAVSTGCSVRLEDCTFENCYCRLGSNGNGNGGALRSTAVYNEVINCTFTNATGVQGGAIAISNTNADTAIFTNCKIDNCSASNQGGAIYCTAKTIIIDGMSNSIINCSATNEGGAIYHGRNVNGSSLSISNMMIDNCSAGKNGAGVYSTAQTVSLNGVTVKNCTSSALGGGLCLIPGSNSGSSRSVTVNDSVIQHNEATSNGGGLYYDCSNGVLSLIDSAILENKSKNGMGGGIYTNALTASLTGTTVTGNTATGNGGGVCHNSNNGRLTVDSCTVSGNTSGGKGGGTYTLAQMTIRNDTSITGNHLSTNVATDAAGVYLQNGRTLTVGTEGANTDDASSVTGNLTKNGNPSNLRLSQGNSLTSDNSTNSIDVLCHLSGEFRVIDAYSKGTQFGTTEVSTAASPVYTTGFSDVRHVFTADDDTLYGIIDRSDATLRKIIWAGEPICKITDANGRLLYLDTIHEYPAVFDKLDTSNPNDTSSVSAFSILRNAEPQLYYADGTLYTGSTYQVKMLVENYTAKNRINTKFIDGRTIILTTAGSADSQYPYRGRSGTRSTITRGTSGTASSNNFITANVNLTLTNIVLDGGSESGVTATGSTRIINATQNGITVTLGRNSALQNSSVSGNNNGGAVYLNNASLVIEGGAIRNCAAANGGAVYKDGNNGSVTMTGGNITRCTAAANGGGIYIQKGPAAANGDSLTITGGSITRCHANGSGGGVWINDNYKMSMAGGNISQNSANTAGGGIAVGGKNARIYFSGAPFVYGNTCNASVSSSKASNVQMDQGFSVSNNNPGTIIHTTGLIRGATIGVYVPGEDHNDNYGGSLYDAHGAEIDPFATYEGTPAGFNYFINDRNGLKGGLLEEQAVGTDMKIYWRQIYTLEVNLEVLSKAASDKEKDFHFTLTLSGTVGDTQWNEVNTTYGDLDFHAGVATFTLNGSTKLTTMADLLPLGYGYTVTMDADDAAGFTVYPGLTQSGEMNNPSQFLYTVNFRVVKDVICKITDETYGLLYYKRGEAYAEAVYDALVSAFNRVNMGELYYKVGDSYIPYTSNDHRIEMLVPDYEMTEAATLNAGKTVLLTTADPNADDGFPYAGSSTAVIRRGFNGASMITVNGDLTAGNITLDGNGSDYSISANGGIVNVASGASLTAGTGATLQNATTSGSGAAVYLAQGAKMYISGEPVFSNNISTGVSLGSSATNGSEPYTQAKQDIYIAGYANASAASLVVTGELTGSEGSIWVWPENADHYKYGTQFATMQGGIRTGLNVFRNARTDSDTKNAALATPKYLYGVSHDGDTINVYWNAAWLTISKEIDGNIADMTQTFPFTVLGLTAGDTYAFIRYTSANGIDWTAETGTSATGTLTADASGALSFTLGHHQRIVIIIPSGMGVTVSETNSIYKESYVIGNGSSTMGYTTESITMDDDTSVTFTNTLNAVAPTGYGTATIPYVLMLMAGLALVLTLTRRRKGGGEDV